MARKTAWIYTRINDYGDANMAIERQSKDLCEYAAQLNLDVIGITSDMGSGISLDRPGLNSVVDGARLGAFDILLVKNASRLVRGANVMNHLLTFFHQQGVEVYTHNEGKITCSPQSIAPNMIGGIQ